MDNQQLGVNNRPQFHLRRIGQPATKSYVPDIMDFHKVVSIIGRNLRCVDFILDSSDPVRSSYISRLHARVVIQRSNQHRLFDDSRNGIFVNHVKISGSKVLQEGDIVTFGHPNGENTEARERRSPSDSEYMFLFERCNCPRPEDRSPEDPVHVRNEDETDNTSNVAVSKVESALASLVETGHDRSALREFDQEREKFTASQSKVDDQTKKETETKNSVKSNPHSCSSDLEVNQSEYEEILTDGGKNSKGTCEQVLKNDSENILFDHEEELNITAKSQSVVQGNESIHVKCGKLSMDEMCKNEVTTKEAGKLNLPGEHNILKDNQKFLMMPFSTAKGISDVSCVADVLAADGKQGPAESQYGAQCVAFESSGQVIDEVTCDTGKVCEVMPESKVHGDAITDIVGVDTATKNTDGMKAALKEENAIVVLDRDAITDTCWGNSEDFTPETSVQDVAESKVINLSVTPDYGNNAKNELFVHYVDNIAGKWHEDDTSVGKTENILLPELHLEEHDTSEMATVFEVCTENNEGVVSESLAPGAAHIKTSINTCSERVEDVCPEAAFPEAGEIMDKEGMAPETYITVETDVVETKKSANGAFFTLEYPGIESNVSGKDNTKRPSSFGSKDSHAGMPKEIKVSKSCGPEPETGILKNYSFTDQSEPLSHVIENLNTYGSGDSVAINISDNSDLCDKSLQEPSAEVNEGEIMHAEPFDTHRSSQVEIGKQRKICSIVQRGDKMKKNKLHELQKMVSDFFKCRKKCLNTSSVDMAAIKKQNVSYYVKKYFKNNTSMVNPKEIPPGKPFFSSQITCVINPVMMGKDLIKPQTSVQSGSNERRTVRVPSASGFLIGQSDEESSSSRQQDISGTHIKSKITHGRQELDSVCGSPNLKKMTSLCSSDESSEDSDSSTASRSILTSHQGVYKAKTPYENNAQRPYVSDDDDDDDDDDDELENREQMQDVTLSVLKKETPHQVKKQTESVKGTFSSSMFGDFSEDADSIDSSMNEGVDNIISELEKEVIPSEHGSQLSCRDSPEDIFEELEKDPGSVDAEDNDNILPQNVQPHEDIWGNTSNKDDQYNTVPEKVDSQPESPLYPLYCGSYDENFYSPPPFPLSDDDSNNDSGDHGDHGGGSGNNIDDNDDDSQLQSTGHCEVRSDKPSSLSGNPSNEVICNRIQPEICKTSRVVSSESHKEKVLEESDTTDRISDRSDESMIGDGRLSGGNRTSSEIPLTDDESSDDLPMLTIDKRTKNRKLPFSAKSTGSDTFLTDGFFIPSSSHDSTKGNASHHLSQIAKQGHTFVTTKSDPTDISMQERSCVKPVLEGQVSIGDLSEAQLSHFDHRYAKQRSPKNKLLERKKQTLKEQKGAATPAEPETRNDFPSSSSAQLENFVERCRSVLSDIKTTFKSNRHLVDIPRLKTWWDELKELHKFLKLPKTVIAVIGETGSGKSSMLNAVLEQPGVLPTSGMRACTSAVVKVTENKEDNKFKAEVEFFSEKEWDDELKLLLRDVSGPDGKVRKRQPDAQTEAGITYAKLKAVYGKVELETIKDTNKNSVTKWLGKTKEIKASSAEELRKEVTSYIEATDDGEGGQFWPIVKQVHVRLPGCDVLSSGAVLVDLPGVRDSNEARDRIAKEFLKNSTTVWVVAAIQRAVDNRTAKGLLDENFRRQLHMDGQYGSVAFICTKTDELVISEMMRSLNVEKECSPFEKEISRSESEIEKLNLTAASLKDKQSSLEEQLTDEEECKLNDEEIHRLERKIRFNRKKIAAVCANARNRFSTDRIRWDFKAGLKEMKRKASMASEEEEDDEADDYADDGNDDEELIHSADNLHVFCISSTEFMKMKKPLRSVDGLSEVFSKPEETQIPALQEFVHSTTFKCREHSAKRMIEKIGHFVFNLQSYLSVTGIQSESQRAAHIVDQHVEHLVKKTEPIVQKLDTELEETFQEQLCHKLSEGARKAADTAKQTTEKWAMPQNTADRSKGGYHSSTYKATINRYGYFSSRTVGVVDFNADLAAPILTAIIIAWEKVFSEIIWTKMEEMKKSIMDIIRKFCSRAGKDLVSAGIEESEIDKVKLQVLRNVQQKLSEMVNLMKEYVKTEQKEISRFITPDIKEKMTETYKKCQKVRSKGAAQSMKEIMAMGIDHNRGVMFNETSTKVIKKLNALKDGVMKRVGTVISAIGYSLKISFEPLWQTSTCYKKLTEALSTCTANAVKSMNSLYSEAGVPLPLQTVDSSQNKSLLVRPSESKGGISMDEAVETLQSDVHNLKKKEEREAEGIKKGKKRRFSGGNMPPIGVKQKQIETASDLSASSKLGRKPYQCEGLHLSTSKPVGGPSEEKCEATDNVGSLVGKNGNVSKHTQITVRQHSKKTTATISPECRSQSSSGQASFTPTKTSHLISPLNKPVQIPHGTSGWWFCPPSISTQQSGVPSASVNIPQCSPQSGSGSVSFTPTKTSCGRYKAQTPHGTSAQQSYPPSAYGQQSSLPSTPVNIPFQYITQSSSGIASFISAKRRRLYSLLNKQVQTPHETSAQQSCPPSTSGQQSCSPSTSGQQSGLPSTPVQHLRKVRVKKKPDSSTPAKRRKIDAGTATVITVYSDDCETDSN